MAATNDMKFLPKALQTALRELSERVARLFLRGFLAEKAG